MERYLVETIKGKDIITGNKILNGGKIYTIKYLYLDDNNKITITFDNDGQIEFNINEFENTIFFKLVDDETTIEHLEKDIVNNPPHYTQSKHECIDIIEEITKQCATPFSGYLLGNIQKYIWRFMYKNGIEDLKKAKWYLEKLISNEEKELI